MIELLPITGMILLIPALVAASYRQVVIAYTQAGGSYVVARDNFGPRVAQIAAAAACDHLSWPQLGRCSSRILAPPGR